MHCSKSYDFNPELPEERRRLVLTMAPVDWAAEWLRPVNPNFKMVGPILAGPGKPLPAHLEVSATLINNIFHYPPGTGSMHERRLLVISSWYLICTEPGTSGAPLAI